MTTAIVQYAGDPDYAEGFIDGQRELVAVLRECVTAGDATCYNGTDAVRLESMARRIRAINEVASNAIAKIEEVTP